MPLTVEEGFRQFHGRLTPLIVETQAAKRHRASIETCLKTNFEMFRFFRTGSFGNGTSIRKYSDVDYFAVIPTRRLSQNSIRSLSKVRQVLATRFPNTGVRVDTPAVKVPFGLDGNELTEVVPADYIGTEHRGFDIFEIADGSGGWMRSSPDAHNAFVSYVNDKMSEKVKPLIRFIKAWKYYINVPISSFYLELFTTQYAMNEQTIIYSIDVSQILYQLWQSQLSPIEDPMGISQHIVPCSTHTQRANALSKVEAALNQAFQAKEYEKKGNIASAFYCWNLLYSSQFPLYR